MLDPFQITKTTTIIYDNDCGLCQYFIDWFVNNIKLNIFILEKGKDLTEIIVITNKETYIGASAIGYLLKYTKYKHIGSFILCPIVLPFANIVYKIIAKYRSNISKIIGVKSCKL